MSANRTGPSRTAIGLVVLVLVAVVGLAGCGDDSSDDGSGDESTSTSAPTDESTATSLPVGAPTLEDSSWTLENASLPEASGREVEITASFVDGEISGSSGCNRYTGTYTLDGDSLTIADDVAGTLMGCDPDVMAAESAYLAALLRTASYVASGGGLELLDDSGAVILAFNLG